MPNFAHVPEWTRWIARDDDGRWYCYENEPEMSGRIPTWEPVSGNFEQLELIEQVTDWRETKQPWPAAADVMNELKVELTNALRGVMTGMEWEVEIDDLGDKLLVTAYVGERQLMVAYPRSTVIWSFSPDRLTAQITLPNPPNYMALVAQFMAGNLFGQGLVEEGRGSDK